MTSASDVTWGGGQFGKLVGATVEQTLDYADYLFYLTSLLYNAQQSSITAHTAELSALSDAIAALNPESASYRPWVYLDSFTGASDDAKLTAAMTYADAQTYSPTIMLSNRLYSFATQGRAPFPGLHISGPPGNRFNAADFSADNRRNHACNLTFDSSGGDSRGWFHGTSSAACAGVTFENLVLRDLSGSGGSHPSFVTQDAGVQWHTFSVHNLTTMGMWHVLGRPTVPLTLLCASLSGPNWHINGSWNTAFSLAGSDSAFWPEGCLLDSPGSGGGDEGATNYHPGGTTTYHLRLSSMDMVTVGPMYITAGTSWRGILVDGPEYDATTGNNGIVRFYGTRVEGRNVSTPSHGNLVRVDGGQAIFNSCWFAKGMSNPTASEDGVIHQTGGTLSVDGGCVYNRASSVAESVPFIYTEGASRTRVYNVLTAVSQGTGWGGDLPVVRNLQSGAGQFRADDTVTVVEV